MFKKVILIILLISAYVYLVTSDPKGNILDKVKKFCISCLNKYKKMDIQYEINKWPTKEDDDY